ncbi:MAG: DUF6691 family protein [Saprospiraceae bacterium]|jgi:uncharacterized membrane protein YedE/YeeE
MSTTPFTNTENIVLNDLEKRELDAMCVNESKLEHQWYHNIKYILVGIVFGIIFVKAEIVSWFRIQEMFRLQSFHMYGIIGSAIAVAMLSIFLIRRYKVKSIYGEEIVIHKKTFNKGNIYGGLIFGIGWALTGACPGPLFAQVGTGVSVVFVTVLSALLGTWVYGYFRKSLPH